MTRDPDRQAAKAEKPPSGFLAEEDAFDRRSLWRLGSWGAAAVGTVLLAVYASQFSSALRRDQIAVASLLQQAQQLQSVAKESQNEARRLASAIDTLNADRDRLYSRVTVLEQGLDSVTGSIKQNPGTAALPAPAAPIPVMAMTDPQLTAPASAASSISAPPPAPTASPGAATAKLSEKALPETATEQPAGTSSIAKAAPQPVAVAASHPLVSPKSMMVPPDAAAAKLSEPDKPAKPAPTPAPANAEVIASAPPADNNDGDSSALAKLPVQHTEFGVDVGGANSLPGLRALWRGLVKSRSNAALATLRPIIVIREGNNGLGMQLRLVAGPLVDAAAAAKICAGMIENERPCQTAVFDGQRLAMTPEEQAGTPGPAGTKPSSGKRYWRNSGRRMLVDEAAKKPDTASTLSSLFGRR